MKLEPAPYTLGFVDPTISGFLAKWAIFILTFPVNNHNINDLGRLFCGKIGKIAKK